MAELHNFFSEVETDETRIEHRVGTQFGINKTDYQLSSSRKAKLDSM